MWNTFTSENSGKRNWKSLRPRLGLTRDEAHAPDLVFAAANFRDHRLRSGYHTVQGSKQETTRSVGNVWTRGERKNKLTPHKRVARRRQETRSTAGIFVATRFVGLVLLRRHTDRARPGVKHPSQATTITISKNLLPATNAGKICRRFWSLVQTQ